MRTGPFVFRPWTVLVLVLVLVWLVRVATARGGSGHYFARARFGRPSACTLGRRVVCSPRCAKRSCGSGVKRPASSDGRRS